MDGSYSVSLLVHFKKFKILTDLFVCLIRFVADRLSAMGETAMSPSTSADTGDVDMALIAEVELSEKFSVQGTSTGKISGRTKVVSI